jgi:hypothetical protein
VTDFSLETQVPRHNPSRRYVVVYQLLRATRRVTMVRVLGARMMAYFLLVTRTAAGSWKDWDAVAC